MENLSPKSNIESVTRKLSLRYLHELTRAKSQNVSIPYAEGIYTITELIKYKDHENWRELKVIAQWCPLDWKGGERVPVSVNLSPLFYRDSNGPKELGLEQYLHVVVKVDNLRLKEQIYSDKLKYQLLCDWEIIDILSEAEIGILHEALAGKSGSSDKKVMPEALEEVLPKVSQENMPKASQEVLPKVSQEKTPKVLPKVLPVKAKSLPKKSPKILSEKLPEEISKVLPEALPEKLLLELPKEVASDQEVKLSKENVKLDRKSLKLKNVKIFIEDEADSLESDNSDYADFMKQKPNLDNL
nr:hypothetical protein [uncultured Pedobacter sp.]